MPSQFHPESRLYEVELVEVYHITFGIRSEAHWPYYTTQGNCQGEPGDILGRKGRLIRSRGAAHHAPVGAEANASSEIEKAREHEGTHSFEHELRERRRRSEQCRRTHC